MTDPSSVRDAMNMVLQVGTVLGLDEPARSLYQETATALAEPPAVARRVFVPIWRKPLMAMGGDCFGSDMLAQAGGQNVFGDRARYPEVTMEDVAAAAPELVLLPDEPFRFREEHIAEFADIAPARVIDGQLLWWYGPRMPGAIGEMRRIVAEGAG
ncbi:MAG: helical backbone metal receptor [Dehalococcoidia bacterium]|nr:helical backbone metal receptor [Dehalococcoidia bacterium]